MYANPQVYIFSLYRPKVVVGAQTLKLGVHSHPGYTDVARSPPIGRRVIEYGYSSGTVRTRRSSKVTALQEESYEQATSLRYVGMYRSVYIATMTCFRETDCYADGLSFLK
nr:hypothetical protein CFP56_74958 [Quercus suber]